MGKNNTLTVVVITCALLALLLLGLNLRLLKLNGEMRQAIIGLKSQSITSKSYIKQSFSSPNIDMNSIISFGEELLDKQDSKSSLYIIYIPDNLCYSCLLSLFIDLNSQDVDKSNIVFILPPENEYLKKDCISHGYHNIILDERGAFASINKSEIIILRFHGGNWGLCYYEDGYTNILRSFFK